MQCHNTIRSLLDVEINTKDDTNQLSLTILDDKDNHITMNAMYFKVLPGIDSDQELCTPLAYLDHNHKNHSCYTPNTKHPTHYKE